MAKLKRLSPELSKLAARMVYERHRSEAMQETHQLRLLLAELIRRGHDPSDLVVTLLNGRTQALFDL